MTLMSTRPISAPRSRIVFGVSSVVVIGSLLAAYQDEREPLVP
jgi:hypothetical protein